MPFFISPSMNSMNHFFPVSFLLQASLSPPAFSLILSPPGAAEFMALFPVTLYPLQEPISFSRLFPRDLCVHLRMTYALGQR